MTYNNDTSRRAFLSRTVGTIGAGAISGVTGNWASRAGADESGELPVTDVNADVAAAMERAPLSMVFDGSTPEACRDWQEAFRERLETLLGDSSPPGEWRARELGRVELDDHVRHELLLTADGVPAVPVYLLVPKSLKPGQRVPGVLCVHGHGPFGNEPIVGNTRIEGVAANIARHNYDYGLQFVRRGYVVAAPCMIPFGRRVDREQYGGNDPCAVTLVRMQALGQLPITSNLRDLRWTIDLLQSRGEVAQDRIGCAGLSYGGRMTMMVSAVDRRIQVASVSGALNLQQERLTARHSCGSQIIPGLLAYGDYSEIGGLIAPRTCVWETGSTDPLIVPRWDDVFRQRLRRVYAALGAAERLHFDRFEGGHEWSGRVAYGLFDDVLKVT